MKKTAYRRAKILEELDKDGQVNVNKLSKLFGVSEVTIRNDLDKLEKNNLLVRAHGGAFKSNNIVLTFSQKKKLNMEVKTKIGKKAASIIEEGDTIILDSGTTTFEISRFLRDFQKLTVITNALDIVNNLAQQENLEVFMPGGYLKEFSMSLVGPLAERNLKQLSCNKLFLGVDSIKPDKGVFTHHVEEAQLNQLMINLAEEVILVSDSSKFAKSGMAFICTCNHIHKLITDSGITEDQIKALEKHNVEVIVV